MKLPRVASLQANGTKSIWFYMHMRMEICVWNKVDLVPLAWEDAYAYGTKWT